MAVGGTETMTFEEMVECDVCMEVMTKPQALPCLHHFCKSCIEKLCQNSSCISCPICRKSTLRKDIQDSFMMNNLLEMYHRHQKPTGGKPDEVCTQCDRPSVTCLCSNCQIKLCNQCKDRHLRIPSCRNHTVIDVHELGKMDTMNIVMYCQLHPACEIKYNCVPCQKAICSECKIEDHDEHKTQTVEEAFSQLSLRTKEHMTNISRSKDDVQRRLAHIKILKSQCKPNCDKIKDRIISHRKEIIERLQKDSHTLLQKIDNQNEAEIKQLGLMESDLENQLASYESLQTWTNTILTRTRGPGALCELQGGLFKRIESCASEQPNVNNSIDAKTVVFAANTDIEARTNNTIGEIKFVSAQKPSTHANSKQAAKVVKKSKEKYDPEVVEYDEAEHFMTRKKKETNRYITIFVNSVTGKSLSLQVSPAETILNVKKKIQDREGIPPDQQRLKLLFLGKELSDALYVADYSIQNGTQLKLELRLRQQ